MSKMASASPLKQLRKVYLNADVYAVCLQHALSTEKEEIMGLLIGDVDEDNGYSLISSSIILRRSDKQADRVEISPEQLMAATTYAEHLAHELKRPMRVVGWYHSHPHITVWPSRVDVGTQALYQSMDCYFVGLIFSVFPNDQKSVKPNDIQLTCFQAQTDGITRREIPIHIRKTVLTKSTLNMMAELPKILRDEEEELAKCFEHEEDTDPLVQFYNDAHKFIGMLNITEKAARPILEVINARYTANQYKTRRLILEKRRLINELKQLNVQ